MRGGGAYRKKFNWLVGTSVSFSLSQRGEVGKPSAFCLSPNAHNSLLILIVHCS